MTASTLPPPPKKEKQGSKPSGGEQQLLSISIPLRQQAGGAKKDKVHGVDRLGSEVGEEWGGRRKAPPPPGTCPGVAWQRNQVRGAEHIKVVRVEQAKFDCAR